MRAPRRLRRRRDTDPEIRTEEPEEPASGASQPEETAAPAPEEPAKEAEPVSAAPGPDSRIPAEARRMAASPYGTARPEAKRPGTRPQVAPKRPAAPENRQRPPMRPTPSGRPGPDGRQAARPSAGEKPQRILVGYAPGRMSEDMTRQMNLRDTEQDRPDSRAAKAYLDRHNPAFREKEAAPAAPVNRTLKIAVLLLVACGLVLAGYIFMRNRNGGDRGGVREAPAVLQYTAPEATDLTAPADLNFSVETDKDTGEIRLTDGQGNPVPADIVVADNAERRAWILTMHAENAFDGAVTLEVRRNGEEEWHRTTYVTQVSVRSGAPAPAAETPVPAEAGTPDGGQEDASDEAEPETGESGEGPEEPEGEPEEAEEGSEEPEEESGEPAEETENPEEGEPAGETGEAGNETEDDEAAIEAWQDENIADEPEEDGDDREIGELKAAPPTNTPAPQEAKPTATPPLAAEASPEANPDLIASTVIYTGNKKEKAYSRPAKELVHMPDGDTYTTKKLGVMTFRGDSFRRNAAVGDLKGKATSLEQVWEVESGSSRGVNQTYYGYGWPGQPAIARWSKQVRGASNLYESKQTKEKLREVIIAGLDGNIRFLDLDDGSITRNSIKLTYPMRGTPSLHTYGEPFISVGQFARKMKVKTGRIGLRQYNLYNQKELKLIDGLDGKQHRPLNNVGSFETSALIDRNSDTLIIAGSNGVLYLEALNTTFDYNAGVLTLAPSVTMMVSRAKGQKNPALTAVESSLAAYDKYVYYADMGGVLRCVDTNTLTPVWAVETGDSVMAAVALDLTEERELNLYTANMLNNRKKGSGSIQIRRYDALSGREAWCTDIGVFKGKKDKDDVGAKASPVIGLKELDELVYFTVTGLSDDGRSQLGLAGQEPAALIALDKQTGKVAWSFGLSSRSESSPVAVYDEDGHGWIIQCEQNGTIHLLDGRSGTELNTLKVNGEIEASPAVYDDMMVIGTTGKGTSFIYGIQIRTGAAEERNTEEEKSTEEERNTEDEEVSGGA